jgi:hypothetical protein
MIRYYIILLIALFAIVIHANADPVNCTVLHISEGSNSGFVLQDSLLYVSAGTYVNQYDISNPANPVLISSVGTQLEINGLVGGSINVFASHRDEGVSQIDFSISENPQSYGPHYYLPNNQYAVHKYIEPYLFYSSHHVIGTIGVKMADTSDPEIPLPGWSVAGGFHCVILDISGSYSFSGSCYWSLFVIQDISNPSEIIPISYTENWEEIEGGISSITATDSFVYIMEYDGLNVVDISDPFQPVIVSELEIEYEDFWGDGHLILMDGFAFQAAGQNGIRVFDMSDPANPFIYGYLDVDLDAQKIDIVGSEACILCAEAGVHLFATGNPVSPDYWLERDPFPSVDPVTQVSIEDDLACVIKAGSTVSVEFYDISSPGQPELLSSLAMDDATTSYQYIAQSGSIACVYSGNLQLIDFNDISSPTIISTLDISGNIGEMIIEEDLVYLVHTSADVSVIDISDPNNPEEIALIECADPRDIDAIQGFAYIADANSGLRIYDMNDPASPQEIGFFPVTGNLRHISVFANMAYLSTNTSVQVIDVSNPANPFIFSTYPTDAICNDLKACRGDILYISYADSMHVLDTRNPEYLEQVAYCDLPGANHGMWAQDSLFISARGTSGFAILDYPGWQDVGVDKNETLRPVGIKLGQNFPNPFNPSTEIEFELLSRQDAKLVLYDILGQQLLVLVDRTMVAGQHSVTLDAGDLPSGVYIYQLETSGQTASQKCLIMK